jgi:hypothetical protein
MHRYGVLILGIGMGSADDLSEKVWEALSTLGLLEYCMTTTNSEEFDPLFGEGLMNVDDFWYQENTVGGDTLV